MSEYERSPLCCVVCGDPISFAKRKSKFCSQSCSAKHSNNARNASGWTQPESQREAARQYNITHPRGAREKLVTTVSQCIVCSKFFPGTRKTCSQVCFNSHCVSNAHKNNLGSHGQRSGKIQYRQDSYGEVVRLESSYEIRFAKILDSMYLRWTRPSHMFWIDEWNNTKRYYPDFYLPDYDLYFDPKNKYQIMIDRPKIQAVIQQNNVKLFIVPNDFINEDFVKSIVDQIGIEPIPEEFQSSVQTTYTTDRQLTS